MSAAAKINPYEKKKQPHWSDVAAIRQEVVGLVSAGEFNKAVHVLKKFSEKDFVYPNFKLKAERYITHAIDLILAIESNRKFSDLSSLTRSKQQELKDKFNKHFEELKTMLDKIESSYRDLKIKDTRSTHYVVKSLWLSILIIVISALVLDVAHGLSDTMFSVIVNGLDHFTEVATQYL